MTRRAPLADTYWLSTPGFTVLVICRGAIIQRGSAPFIRPFVGQDWEVLWRWCRSKWPRDALCWEHLL